MSRGGDRSDGAVALAALVHRLAVLLGAGVAPPAAWRHAARPPLTPIVDAMLRNARQHGLAAAISAVGRGPSHRGARAPAGAHRDPGAAVGPAEGGSSAWSALAAVWVVTEAAGAPFAGTLRGFAEYLRGLASAEREARVALAGPRATTRLVLVLPVIAVLFGALLGQDTVGVLIGTPLGWACVAIGVALMGAGWWWASRLVRRAASSRPPPGLVEELLAIALSGGASVDRARALVAGTLERLGIEADAVAAEETLELAVASGAPAAELLRAEAETKRRGAVAEARERAERLGVTLMLPLGACILPAFVAVGVVPLMASIVGSTLAVV